MTDAVVLDYRESPAGPRLADDVACLWTQDVSAGSSPAVHRVFPDGCIDLIWGLDHEVSVAGPDTGAVLVPLHPGARLTGLRFRPGRAARFLGVPSSELVDAGPRLTPCGATRPRGWPSGSPRRRRGRRKPPSSRPPSMIAWPRRPSPTSSESGYADQAHLTRDCRQLTGLAPTALVSSPTGRP